MSLLHSALQELLHLQLTLLYTDPNVSLTIQLDSPTLNNMAEVKVCANENL